MTWRDDFLSYKLYDLRWIIGELSCRDQPSEITLEANKVSVNRVRFLLQRLEIGSVMSECWGSHGFWCEWSALLTTLLPNRFTPRHKVAQVAEVVADRSTAQVLFNT